MSFKNIVKQIFLSLPAIFTFSLLGVWVSVWIFSGHLVSTLTVYEIFITSVFISLTRLVFYSKTDLSKRQMLVRTGIHYLAVLATVLYSANLWIWTIVKDNYIMNLIAFVGLVSVVYAAVLVSDFLRSKKLANDLIKDIGEQR